MDPSIAGIFGVNEEMALETVIAVSAAVVVNSDAVRADISVVLAAVQVPTVRDVILELAAPTM